MERRSFLTASVALAAAGRLQSATRGAQDPVRVAIVGLRGRGGDHIAAYLQEPNVQIAAICDVDESILQKRIREIEAAGRPKPAAYVDFRRLLEEPSIDAVSIATPNHHHALQAIWACEAGKDVYVEKPCSHTMDEAQQLVAAARRYGRIVQHGTQSRSIPVYREAIQQIREGLIGDVYMARAICSKWRPPIGRATPEPVPPGVDYDLWIGPAPVKPFTRNRFHYNWHWQWDYGNGDIGNQGIHEIDVARWGLGVGLPTKVSAMGGHFMFDDDQETPNVLTAVFEFDSNGLKKTLVFDLRHWITNEEAGIGADRNQPGGNVIGNLFYGCEGYLALNEADTNYKSFLGKERRRGPARAQYNGTLDDLLYRMRRRVGSVSPRGGDHFANFLAAVRSRDLNSLHAEIEEGALSVMLVHLANISYRLGRTIDFDPSQMCCPDTEAQSMFTKRYRSPFTLPEIA
jgi:predicted dehydrogenase